MKSDKATIKTLNAALTDQLTAINQFFLHARIFGNFGFVALDASEYKRSIKAMKLADSLIQRVLFLEGLPNLQKLGKLSIGEDTAEALGADLKMQRDIRTRLVEAITFMEEQRDYVSRELLEDILEETEEHIDWLESQHYLIDKLGIENYLQTQTGHGD